MSHAPFEAAPDSGLEELSTWPFRSDLRKVLGNRSIWQKVQVVPIVGTSLRPRSSYKRLYTHSLADDQVDQ